ncbi:helix-turn-helix transcriptional regulator [Niallia sp. 01092]|uniref:helix-turn-helix transcriptional regulator n=1 Tax=Niallia sp. 01092 TaxID=3457759 RepID=UPI003FD557E6
MTTRKKELLSVKEIMDITGLGKNKVYELLHSGEFTVYRFGAKFMALEKDFYDWLYNDKRKKNSYILTVKGLK